MKRKPLGILSSTLSNITATSELDYETKEIVAELKRTKTPYTIIDPDKLCIGIECNNPVARFTSSDGSSRAEDLQGLLVRRTRGKEEYILDFLEYCKASYPDLCMFDELSSFKRPTSKVAHLLPKLNLTAQPDTLITKGYLPDACSISLPFVIKPSHGFKGEGVERYHSIDDAQKRLSKLPDEDNALGYGVILQEEITKVKEFRVMVIGGKALGVAEKIVNSEDDIALSADKGHDFRKYEGDLTEDVCSLAQEAADLASLDFAGVDIVFDGDQLILLECNRNPQFSAFDHALHIRSARAMVSLMLERMAKAEKSNDKEEVQEGQPRIIQATKPRVFIGSSSKHLYIAEALQQGLTQSADVEVWNQGIFEASEVVFTKLTEVAKEFDAAVFVLSPDDLVVKKERELNQPRDNVLFEIGLFMGSLGAKNVWLVVSRKDKLALPSDFDGLNPITWEMQKSGNLRASIGEACTEIKQLLTKQPLEH
ncbi:MAG: nucleotide-binding protein [Candidatus Thiodiazotropha sp. (ex Lucina aurantia)]|nr:nucleotide-binding protein [Candidatus Thiodiazotropha sp. (ex Lucina pensylvanica)]MBT3022113.1 nucleotide-binding protein [Candidatus Thiodiazotropha taylori]MBV2100724.1 nucleotide-binding protein [Candidatus Thiodiazotropha sp. (ex Codakia orbicularis)]MBV2103363.1 nucleotide-binding protein [Candidatus Thiodiazotropha sp. (ex Lucina aurantia)]MBV2116274.1 nucleotide-binding protein [Candidatus Thiodiazotropha sp. (ex Lucina aurantia)]